MLKITLAMLALMTAPVQAQAQDAISFTLGSRHINSTLEYNEFNPGVFYTWEEGYTVGAYINSYTGVGLYGGGEWAIGAVGPVELSAFAGLALYQEINMDVVWTDKSRQDEAVFKKGAFLVPMAGIRATVGNVFLNVTPFGDDTFDGLLSMGLTFDLGGAQ